jgi:protein TonB
MERSVIDGSVNLITLTDIPNTMQQTTPPPPPRPPIPIEAPEGTDLPDFDTDLNPGEDVPLPPPPSPIIPDDQDSDDRYIFVPISDPPEPVGGMAAILKALHYPDLAIRAGIEGTVVVKAWISKDGVVTKTEIIHSIGGGCDEAAMDAVRATRFVPGSQRDRPVNVVIAVPVRFSLK